MEERKIIVADPTALGLFGLAIVTFVASFQKLEVTSGTSLIVPWAIFLGGLIQVYASIQDAKKNNVFGATAFGAFGFFWISVAMTWLIQNGVFGEKMAATMDMKQLGFAFVGYLIFSLYMTFAALTTNKMLFIIFIFIDILFLGLSLSTMGIAKEATHLMAAYAELIISLIGFYGSAACIINIQFGKQVLPLGKPIIQRK